MKNFILALQVVFAALAFVSCVRERGTAGDKERISLGFAYNPEYSIETKSILTASGIETKLTSVLVAAYLSESGKLDKIFMCDGSSDRLSLLKDIRYDLFFLANFEDMSPDRIPENERDIIALQYRIPSYKSINDNGIPACAILESQCFSKDTEIPVNLSRLLCKINVHISHKGITGKTQNDSQLFKNVQLYIRNANGLLSPFADGGSRAVSTGDILPVSDYDPDMAGSSTDFIFYVPENLQGQLLPNNLDPDKKSAGELLSAGKNPDLATYVEFTGMLMSSAGGIGGSLLYRIYLGRDNVSDFSLERNKVYNLGIDLMPDNLMHPYWKVNHGEDWSDNRVLRLLDSSGAVLPDNSGIAVRVGHPAVVKLFMNTDGGSSNMFGKAVNCGYFTDEDEDSFVHLNWSSNVVSADQDVLSLPGRLSDEGISVSMNSRTGVITFSVENETDLVIGKEYELEFFLSPGRAYHTQTVKLMVLPECKLDMDSNFLYMGQKRKINVLNALGTYSVEIKSGSSYVDVDNDDPTLIYGKSVGQVSLRLKSSRPVDDPELNVSLQVKKPFIYNIGDVLNTLVYLDGVPKQLEYYMMDRDTNEPLDRNDFDPKRMSMYLPATVSHAPRGDFDPDVFLDYDPYAMTLAVKRINGDRNILEYGDEYGFVDRITTSYPGLPTIVMDVFVKNTFWQYAGGLGTFKLTSLSSHSSGDDFSGNIDMIAPKEVVCFVFSGKMSPKVEIGSRNLDEVTSKYTISFPREEQEKYLVGDAGNKVITAIVTNAMSGEEIRHDFSLTIKGSLGIGLVLEPVGNDLRDAVVHLCWKDCWRNAVTKDNGRGTLSSVNAAGDINDLFNMLGNVKLNGGTHTVKELWPATQSLVYENLTLQDLIDFMSSHNVMLQAVSGKVNSMGTYYSLSANTNVIIEKDEKTSGYCRWIGCYLPDAEGGRWIDYAQ